MKFEMENEIKRTKREREGETPQNRIKIVNKMSSWDYSWEWQTHNRRWKTIKLNFNEWELCEAIWCNIRMWWCDTKPNWLRIDSDREKGYHPSTGHTQRSEVHQNRTKKCFFSSRISWWLSSPSESIDKINKWRLVNQQKSCRPSH